MLTAARTALAAHGLLAPDAPLPPFWARMSGNLVLMVYGDNGTMHSVKVGIRSRLDREHRGLSAGYAAMPHHVPRPVGLSMSGAYQVLVSAGVPHDRLLPRDVGSPLFVRGLTTYIDASVAHFTRGGSEQALDLRAALQRAGEAIAWSGRHGYCEGILPLVASLPRISQHGDFAINNLGVAGDHLVFFDWEDFGLADLPGLDLAVLLLSVHDFDLWRLRSRLRSASFESHLAHRLCERLHVPDDRFEQLLPAFLALFVELKRGGGYDEASSGRALAALRQWTDAP